jgi:MoaA/NifB/PqqE/SkfB family radical SAM enzyme
MKFNKIYIEITNICGLHCSFCPTKILQNKTMKIYDFKKVIAQVKYYTKVITFHIFGDPLTVSNLEEYLDIAHKHNLKVEIVTTGYYLNNFNLNLFLHPSIKQINFSLNSYDKNEMKLSLDDYLKPMLQLCDLKLEKKIQSFINFRLWNITKNKTINSFNEIVLKKLFNYFDPLNPIVDFKHSIRLENQILVDFDEYFQWPNLQSTYSSNAPCYGLRSHFGILSSGKVVPCCLDSYGCIDLGNIFETQLKDILSSTRVQNIITGFKNGIAIEELCQKCTFKERFLEQV